MKTFFASLSFTVIVSFAFWGSRAHVSADEKKTQKIPHGELGQVIKLGESIVMQTGKHELSKKYVGNELTCNSCHLDGGKDPHAASFLGVATAYPAWSPREKKVITLEDRILNCFMRSMNGTRPENGSEVSVAIAAYITFLSEGDAISMNPDGPFGPYKIPELDLQQIKSDEHRGEHLYQEKCASCHHENGTGTEEGPPVWGARSYNDGAGLAQNTKLAAWLKVAMPLGDATLTPQEALDIAAYVDSKPRP